MSWRPPAGGEDPFHKVFALPLRWVLALFVSTDLVAFAMGMGVPIFCVLLGFLVGCYIGFRLALQSLPLRSLLERMLLWSAASSGVTCVFTLLLWGPLVLKLRGSDADLANFGIPLILYHPRARFIGWLALMIALSPVLQFLVTLFGAHVGLRMATPPAREQGLPC